MKEFIASFTIVFLGSLLLVRDLYSLPPPPPPPKFTLNSITPSITQVNSFQSYGPITAKNFVFRSVGTEGESYTVEWSVLEQPGSVIGIGADITSYDYDDSAKTLTITFDQVAVKEPPGPPPDQEEEETSINATGEIPDIDGLIILSLEPVKSGTKPGPPEAAKGSYMATDVLAWNLIPPSPPDDIFFGFELNGKEGETGFFRMKIPDTLIDHLSELAGKTLNVDDLAIFNDGKQASLDIEDLSDGIIVNIKTVFKEGFNLAPPPPMQQEPAKGFLSKGGDSSSGLTKTYSVGEREDSTSDGGVAATVKTSTVKKTAKLTAVVSTGLSAGQTIKVQKRVLTSSGKKTWRTVKSVSVPDNKTQEKFKVKVSKGGESPNSSTYTYRAKGTDSNKRKKFSITVTD